MCVRHEDREQEADHRVEGGGSNGEEQLSSTRAVRQRMMVKEVTLEAAQAAVQVRRERHAYFFSHKFTNTHSYAQAHTHWKRSAWTI